VNFGSGNVSVFTRAQDGGYYRFESLVQASDSDSDDGPPPPPYAQDEILQGFALPMPVASGTAPALIAEIACPNGRVVLR